MRLLVLSLLRCHTSHHIIPHDHQKKGLAELWILQVNQNTSLEDPSRQPGGCSSTGCPFSLNGFHYFTSSLEIVCMNHCWHSQSILVILIHLSRWVAKAMHTPKTSKTKTGGKGERQSLMKATLPCPTTHLSKLAGWCEWYLVLLDHVQYFHDTDCSAQW